MEMHGWAHPFDASGERRPYADIPASITELADDAHRSLAGFLRNAGGFAKDASPFAEFLWADYLRPHITRGRIRKRRRTAPPGAGEPIVDTSSAGGHATTCCMPANRASTSTRRFRTAPSPAAIR